MIAKPWKSAWVKTGPSFCVRSKEKLRLASATGLLREAVRRQLNSHFHLPRKMIFLVLHRPRETGKVTDKMKCGTTILRE
jgi:hypothetical protein